MYSVRKTRSLSICLIMVLSALGPLASADHDSHVAMNSSLFIDGAEYEMEEIPFWGELDSCTEYNSEDGDGGGYYECESDTDGDGEADETWDFEDCDNSSGEWICTYWTVHPLIEAGNYSLLFEVYDLEPNTNFSVSTSVHSWERHSGSWDMNWGGYIDSDSAGDISSSETYLIVENATCSGYAHVSVHYAENGTNWSSGDSLGSLAFHFDGPCEGDSHLELEYDGVQWEPYAHEYPGDQIMDCEEYGANWFCTMDWDGDGDADGLNQFENCHNSSGDWECVEHYSDPIIEEGSYTMVIEAFDLESNESYLLEVASYDCEHWNCENEDRADYFFNGSTGSVTFNMAADNYSCNVGIQVSLMTVHWDNSSGGWSTNDQVEWRTFGFKGPCDMPPSPFTLYMDGVEHENTIHYSEYDECVEDYDHFQCWQYDWDEDGDGDPENWDHMEDCEEDVNGTWWCEGWNEHPHMDAGNHSMQLDVDDLAPGYSYMLVLETNHETWNGHDHEHDVMFFNSTTSAQFFFIFESTDQTCGVHFSLSLYTVSWNDNGTEYSQNGTLYHEYLSYSGPCAEPPSPFTLTYDGVEWEPEWHYHEYDHCEEDAENFDDGGFICQNEDWDEGHWDYWGECEEDASTGTWYCQAWWSNPEIEEGNHTMVI